MAVKRVLMVWVKDSCFVSMLFGGFLKFGEGYCIDFHDVHGVMELGLEVS